METILVGISLHEEDSAELLSWAISVAARPGDTVVALHILVVKKDEKKFDSTHHMKTGIEKANAFTVGLLGAFTDLCQAKQVKAEAKVLVHSSVEKGLVDEAAALEASFLILGASRYQVRRPTLGVTKYCLQHAPAGCSVITVKGRRIPPRTESFPKIADDSDLSHEGIHKLNLKWPHKDVGKTISSIQKLLLPRISFGNGEITVRINKRTGSFHLSKDKLSPRGVLEGDHDESSASDSYKIVGSTPSFSRTLSNCDEDSVSELNQHNCLNILKNVNLAFPPLFSSSFSRRSMHGISKYNEDSYVPPAIRKPSWRCFTYEEIALATNEFHPDNLVGRGGYAEVYRGELPDGQMIAVKRLASGSTDEQKEKDFLTELGIIGHVCHPNTASLIGCCIENGLHLIFDFSPHGSLASLLHGRLEAVLGLYKPVAGATLKLELEQLAGWGWQLARKFHKSHFPLMDKLKLEDPLAGMASQIQSGSWNSTRISDFGLAKWLPRQWTHHSITPIEGTFGYLAPEYFLHGIVDEKTDVFAFGVLLLEIISGRKPADISEKNLLLWWQGDHVSKLSSASVGVVVGFLLWVARPLLESGNITELADPRLDGQYDEHQMQRMVLTASLCIRQSAIWRPSMSEVLQLLTDGQSPEIVECWTMPRIKTDEVDDYWDFDEQESKQRSQIHSPLH
eukprot:Gb_23838 [translate_table: standard]